MKLCMIKKNEGQKIDQLATKDPLCFKSVHSLGVIYISNVIILNLLFNHANFYLINISHVKQFLIQSVLVHNLHINTKG